VEDELNLNKMKIKASDLWPVVLHFIQEYLSKDDLETFTTYFKLQNLNKDVESHPLVAAGGLPALLKAYLKNNKEVFRKFKNHCEGKP
jgi:hypothetical protein